MAGSSPVGFVATLLDTVANKMTTDPDHVIHGIGDEPDVLELVVVRKGTRAVLILRRVGRLAERSETREVIAAWVSP
ncbi:hypothetical protein [Streptomyces sp. A1-5]|uniref:hypothetical protein n=1 Tax=Streptomyces sp. A1-5 TaxID=2738410 RepID=UPI001F3D3B1F|nr:hypothetical protein [Streptomyces sp. A1-5]